MQTRKTSRLRKFSSVGPQTQLRVLFPVYCCPQYSCIYNGQLPPCRLRSNAVLDILALHLQRTAPLCCLPPPLPHPLPTHTHTHTHTHEKKKNETKKVKRKSKRNTHARANAIILMNSHSAIVRFRDRCTLSRTAVPWLLNVQPTCRVSPDAGLLRHLYVLPHCTVTDNAD